MAGSISMMHRWMGGLGAVPAASEVTLAGAEIDIDGGPITVDGGGFGGVNSLYPFLSVDGGLTLPALSVTLNPGDIDVESIPLTVGQPQSAMLGPGDIDIESGEIAAVLKGEEGLVLVLPPRAFTFRADDTV